MNLLVLFVLSFTTHPAVAQQDGNQGGSGGTKYSISVIPMYQFDTDLDSGGNYNVQRYFFRFNANHRMTPVLKAGIGLSYDHEKWDVTGATEITDLPWENIHRSGIDLSLQYTGIKDWTLLFLPGIEASHESGADWNNSLQIGCVAAAAYRFSGRLTLGLGAGVYAGLEKTQGYPVLFVRWQITDRLTLANPFRPGPAGPAGLELIYSLDENWSLAAGSAYRSYRFRLDDEAPAPEGIGEVRFIPVWGRVTLQLDRSWAFDLYAGYTFAGKLTVEDQNGNDIAETEQDPAPFGAIAVSCEF